ncbi:MAG TPA: proton-conducting transporter membrane subunit [Solirubrobacteraceae bacterium]|nr:proton-conducting transporter membrane subunit [Solirubrobacteraceae bacterium]
MSWSIYALVAVPALAALLAVTAGWRLAQAATLVAGLASFGLATALALDVRHGRVVIAAAGWLRVDPLGAVFLLATGLLYAIAGAFSVGYLKADQRRPGFLAFARRYFVFLNLFGATLLLVPVAADFGTLWVALELTTIVSAMLVAIDRTDAALEASWKYVLIASCGLGIALLAIVILYATGTSVLGGAYLPRFERFLAHGHGLSRDAVRLSFALAVVGFGTKVGLVPMHTWLPDAHSEAPAPVSALLSGSLLAAAFYAVLRFFQVAVASGQRSFAEHVLIAFGAISLVVAALFVVRQSNYKRLLAYSSIEHMGIIALGIGFGAPLAVAGALLHVITHAAAKGLAFLGSGSLLRGYDTKEVDGIVDAARAMPFTGTMFFAAALALSGLPLSGVFRSEFQIVVGGFAHAQYVGVALMLVLVNLAFFGIIWHAGRMVLGRLQAAPGPGGRPLAAATARERSAWMVVGMLGCLIVSVGLGVHVPGALSALLRSAGHGLGAPS